MSKVITVNVKRNGYIQIGDDSFMPSYIRLLIRRGDTVEVFNKDGMDITAETLISFIGNEKEALIELAALLGNEVLHSIIESGGVNEYKLALKRR